MDAFTKLAPREGAPPILEDGPAITIRVDRIRRITHAFFHRAYKYGLAERPAMAILVGADVLCFVRCSSGIGFTGKSKSQGGVRSGSRDGSAHSSDTEDRLAFPVEQNANGPR